MGIQFFGNSNNKPLSKFERFLQAATMSAVLIFTLLEAISQLLDIWDRVGLG